MRIEENGSFVFFCVYSIEFVTIFVVFAEIVHVKEEKISFVLILNDKPLKYHP